MPRVVPGYKDEARGRIVAAARNMFREQGFRDTTMDDIAARLGVSKAALYLYFHSKDDLLAEVIESAPVEVWEAIRRSYPKEERAISAEVLFDALKRMVGQWSPGLFFEILSEASRKPVIRRAIKADYDRTVAIAADVLTDLVDRGFLRPEADVLSLSLGLTSLFYGLMSGLVVGAKEADLRRSWVRSVEAMARGLESEDRGEAIASGSR